MLKFRQSVVCEPLEERRLLAIISWDGGGDGTYWFDPLNWSGDTLPGPEDDVTISVSGNPTIQYVEHGDATPIKSLVCDETLSVFGPLAVSTTAQVNATLGLRNGKLVGGTWDVSGGFLNCDISINRIIGARVIGEIQLGGADNFPTQARLELVGETVFDVIRFMPSATSSLGLSPGFDMQQGTVSVEGGGGIGMSAAGHITIGPGITFTGSRPQFGSSVPIFNATMSATSYATFDGGIRFDGDQFINRGSIHAQQGSSALGANVVNNEGLIETLHPQANLLISGRWSNTGTIRALEGQIGFAGTVTTANLGTVQAQGGTIQMSSIDNTAQTLTLNSTTGSWSVGLLSGGTVKFQDGHRVINTQLRDVLVIGELIGSYSLAGTTRFTSATVSGSSVSLRFANGYVLMDPLELSNNGQLLIEQFATATIGPSGVLRLTNGFGTIDPDSHSATLVNEGLIEADSVNTLIFNATLVNRGTVRALRGTARFNLEAENEAILEAAQNGVFEVHKPIAQSPEGRFTGTGFVRFAADVHNVSSEFQGFDGTIALSGGTSVSFGQAIHPGALIVAGSGITRANFRVDQTLDFPTTLSSNGVLEGTGNITLTNTLTWHSGTLFGPGTFTIAKGGMINMPTGATRLLSRTLRNAGVVNAVLQLGDTALSISSAGRFENLLDGTFNFANGRITSSTSATFENAGTMNVGQTGTSASFQNVALNNAGLVNLGGGTLQLLAGGSSSSPMQVADGAVLQFSGPYLHTGTTALTGAGEVRFASGAHDFSTSKLLTTGTVRVEAGSITVGHADFSPNLLHLTNGGQAIIESPVQLANLKMEVQAVLLGSGSVTVIQNLQWFGGTIEGAGATIIAPAATGDIRRDNPLTLRRSIVNGGTVNFINGMLSLNTALAHIENQVGGTINIMNSAGASGSNQVLTNNGTIIKTGSASTLGGFQIVNNGTMRIESGSLTLPAGGAQLSNGRIDVQANATAVLGGTWTSEPGAQTIGDGLIRYTSGTMAVHGLNFPGKFTIESGAQVGVHDSPRTGSIAIDGTGSAFMLAPANRVWVTRSIAISQQGKLDLNRNAMIIDYDGAAPSPIGLPGDPTSIFGMIASAHAGGTWSGPGITSSAAAADSRTAIGFGEASTLFASFPAIFLGHTTDDSAVLIRHTLKADANLDQIVNMIDFDRLAANFAQSPRPFALGDFNYDAHINLADFNLLASSFGNMLGHFASTGDEGESDRLIHLLL